MPGWYNVRMNWIPIRVSVRTPKKDLLARKAPVAPGPKLEKSVSGSVGTVERVPIRSLVTVVDKVPHRITLVQSFFQLRF